MIKKIYLENLKKYHKAILKQGKKYKYKMKRKAMNLKNKEFKMALRKLICLKILMVSMQIQQKKPKKKILNQKIQKENLSTIQNSKMTFLKAKMRKKRVRNQMKLIPTTNQKTCKMENPYWKRKKNMQLQSNF